MRAGMVRGVLAVCSYLIDVAVGCPKVRPAGPARFDHRYSEDFDPRARQLLYRPADVLHEKSRNGPRREVIVGSFRRSE